MFCSWTFDHNLLMVDYHFWYYRVCIYKWLFVSAYIFFFFLQICILHHESDTGCHWSQLSPFEEGSTTKGRWSAWPSKILQEVTKVPCWSCEGGEVLQLLPFFDLQNAAKACTDGKKFQSAVRQKWLWPQANSAHITHERAPTNWGFNERTFTVPEKATKGGRERW